MPQQHFIADDDRLDNIAVTGGDLQPEFDLLLVVEGVCAYPQAQQHFESQFAGDGRNLIHTVSNRINAHTADTRRQQCQVMLQLCARHDAGAQQLFVVRRGIRQAVELAGWRIDHADRATLTPPDDQRHQSQRCAAERQ